MAKISALTELTTVATEDLLAIVDDPAGTPVTKKITRGNLVAGLAATSHSHAISDVTNLQANLDGKAASSHAHLVADLPVIFKALSADATGTNGTGGQPWFPTSGGASVDANTTYFFEGVLHTTRAAGTTSHTTNMLFGGTATLTNIRYLLTCKTGDTGGLAAANMVVGTSASATSIKAASVSATEQTLVYISGCVRINGAGTFIPQFSYSAAPGGAPTITTNSWFRLLKIGTGSVVSQGTWS